MWSGSISFGWMYYGDGGECIILCLTGEHFSYLELKKTEGMEIYP